MEDNIGLKNIYINALKGLKGFDESAIEKAISLAQNDVVETIEEFIDFINFNIEEKKFPQIIKPFDVRIIKEVVDKVKHNEKSMPLYVSTKNGAYPLKLLNSNIEPLSPLSYKGNLKNVDRKTIMITGSSSITKNARMASKYFGRFFARSGYNILTSFAEGCEQNSILGCMEGLGRSTFFLHHDIDSLSEKEKNIIEKELGTGHAALLSIFNSSDANINRIEETYSYIAAITDCLIVPQLSYSVSSLLKFKFPTISLSTKTIVPSLILDEIKRLVSINSLTYGASCSLSSQVGASFTPPLPKTKILFDNRRQ